VTELACGSCGTRVSGHYLLPVFMQLNAEEQEFILQFFVNSGSLKEMAKQMGKSYPTVRNKLDDMIAHIKELGRRETDPEQHTKSKQKMKP